MTRPLCSALHGMQLTPCGKPATWKLRAAYVCASCRLLLAHMPAELFARVS